MLGFHKVKEKISDLFSQSEGYLLIEILNHYVQVTAIRFWPAKKKIRILKNFCKNLSDFNQGEAIKELASLIKKSGKPEKFQIILSLDSKFATTIYSSVSLVRPHPKEIIDEADIDNLISQAIWRFFDRQRLKVAQKMGVADVDVLLSDARIRGIKLDGHKVVNPIGFRAKTAEIFFSQTFLPREFLKELRDILPKERVVLITETGTAISHVLSRLFEKDRFLVANLFPNETSVFLASSGRLSHLDSFEWGENDLAHLLQRHLRLDPAVSRAVIANYAESGGSEIFLRRLENILVKELQVFANGLESLADEELSEVYLNPFFTIPPIVFSERFQNRFQKSLKLLPLSTNLITEKTGYEVQLKKTAPVKNLLSLLAAFLEVNYLPQNDKMSHLANRRVRWLVN